MVIFGSLPTSADYAAVGGLPRPTLYESGVYKSGLSSLEAIYSGLADGLRVARSPAWHLSSPIGMRLQNSCTPATGP